MITIEGIQISDYSTTGNSSDPVTNITVATKHNGALSGISIDDVVTVEGDVDGSFTYQGDDQFGQKCFTLN